MIESIKNEFIFYYKKRMIESGYSEKKAIKKSLDAWKSYYQKNKGEIDNRLVVEKEKLANSIEREFLNLEISELNKSKD